MPERTTHPSPEQLIAYNRGQLPADEAVAIESHISECEPCCETIVGLSSDDTFVGLLKEARQLPVAEACAYIRQAAIGLQHAHERGMVHRDIKPHNLMVTTDGTVKILDFGLASLAPEALSEAETVAARSDLTAAGAIMGTPDFISPEQAEDARQADIRSDILLPALGPSAVC